MNTLLAEAPDVLTVDEVCALLKTKRPTVYTMIKRKELHALKVGNSYRVPKKGLLAYLDSAQTETDSANDRVSQEKLFAGVRIKDGAVAIAVLLNGQEYSFPTSYFIDEEGRLVKDQRRRLFQAN